MAVLIDRDKLIADFKSDTTFNGETMIEAEYLIIHSEPIDATPIIHAHFYKDITKSRFPICSNCESINAAEGFYCSVCGAKMDEGV